MTYGTKADILGAGPARTTLLLHRASTVCARSVHAPIGPGQAPDAALYAKAPLLLFGLEQRIGRAGIHRLFARLAAEPCHTTALFLSILTEVAGSDVAKAFEAELRN